MVRLAVDGVSCEALVDTGCTKSIAHVSLCSNWRRQVVSVTTLSGEWHQCEGTGKVHVQLPSGAAVSVDVLVVASRPLNFDFILGMNGVEALQGVTVRAADNVRFGIEEIQSPVAAATVHNFDEKDFTVTLTRPLQTGRFHGSGVMGLRHRDC